MSSITSHNTIEMLRRLFSSYGLPKELVSDNGPQLVSKEFSQFLELNWIKHTAVPAYHPASNGAAERSVQILKRSLMKNVLEADGKATLPLSHCLENFLIVYRSTPHSVAGRTPKELFLKNQIQTRFSLLKPELTRHVKQKQSEQNRHHDHRAPPIRFFRRRGCAYPKFQRGTKEMDSWNSFKETEKCYLSDTRGTENTHNTC